MKIMASTFGEGKCCYVQMKDLLFMGGEDEKDKFREYYEDLKSRGIKDKDFIHVRDYELINAVVRDNKVVDFLDYRKKPIWVTVGDLMAMLSQYYVQKDRNIIRNAVHDLRDIVAYKRDVLDYSIPAVPTGRYVMEGKNFVFSTTIFEGLYLLRTSTEDDVMKYDFTGYLASCLETIILEDYPAYVQDELDIRFNKVGNGLVINISPKVKKNIVDRYRAKKENMKKAF